MANFLEIRRAREILQRFVAERGRRQILLFRAMPFPDPGGGDAFGIHAVIAGGPGPENRWLFDVSSRDDARDLLVWARSEFRIPGDLVSGEADCRLARVDDAPGSGTLSP